MFCLIIYVEGPDKANICWLWYASSLDCRNTCCKSYELPPLTEYWAPSSLVASLFFFSKCVNMRRVFLSFHSLKHGSKADSIGGEYRTSCMVEIQAIQWKPTPLRFLLLSKPRNKNPDTKKRNTNNPDTFREKEKEKEIWAGKWVNKLLRSARK